MASIWCTAYCSHTVYQATGWNYSKSHTRGGPRAIQERNQTIRTIPLPRLIIITGNNGTISTQTITGHQPPADFRKNRKSKRQQQHHDHTLRTLRLHHLLHSQAPTPLPSMDTTASTTQHTTYSRPHPYTPPTADHWQSPRNPSRRILTSPTNGHPPNTVDHNHNNFTPLEITDTPNPINDINLPTYPLSKPTTSISLYQQQELIS